MQQEEEQSNEIFILKLLEKYYFANMKILDKRVQNVETLTGILQ